MLIGVISDTHDRLPVIDAALHEFRRRGVDALIHPGDPGECCGWVTGRCSVAVLDTEGPSAEIVELRPE